MKIWQLTGLFLLALIAIDLGAAEREVHGKHLTVVLDQSKEQIARGETAVLTANVKLSPGMHVYAPGIEPPYLPIELKLERNASAEVSRVRYPVAKRLHLAAVDETVPAYEGEFSIQIEIKALSEAQKDLELNGFLNYQTCDDKICYVPAKIPVSWKLQVLSAPATTLKKKNPK
jgi:DsbC/DsbD-like thiol-disulfide interchange protein